jgi:hypothetical protein
LLKQPWEDEAWLAAATERAKGRRERRRVDGAIIVLNVDRTMG